MHIKDNLINFVYDKNYFIGLYDNYLYCFNYEELVALNNNLVILKMPKWNIEIKGNNLFVNKMCPNEILIKGKILGIEIKYE